jgi:hypothetical protein
MLDPLIHRHFFCADLARNTREAIFGTGGSAETYILVEYPGGWEPRAVTDSTLAEPVKNYLEILTKAPVKAKTWLIKQDRKRIERINMFVVVVREHDPVIYRFELGSYDEMLTIDIAGIVAGHVDAAGSISTAPLFLVCTHGRHDKCCAKFGYPTYKLMHQYAPDNTWQVSHVGGDRFAANVVAFPHGIFYGHVGNEDAIEIVDQYRTGAIQLKNYRGRACYLKEAQAAEYFVRSQSGILELDRLSLMSLEKNSDGSAWTAVFAETDETKRHGVWFSRRRSQYQSFLTCHAASRNSVAQYDLTNYRLVAP